MFSVLLSFNISVGSLDVLQKRFHFVCAFSKDSHHHIYRCGFYSVPGVVHSAILQVTEHCLHLTNTFQCVFHSLALRRLSIKICVFPAHFYAQTVHCLHYIPCPTTVLGYFHGIQFRVDHIYEFTYFPAKSSKCFDFVDEVLLCTAISIGLSVVCGIDLETLVKVISRKKQLMMTRISYPNQWDRHVHSENC